MAKPHFQAGNSQNSGTADESAVSNGEASRRVSETGKDGDWGLPSGGGHPGANLILGSIFVLVLAGVFSFVVYKKMGEAKFQSAADNMQAQSTPAPNAVDGAKPPMTGDPFA